MHRFAIPILAAAALATAAPAPAQEAPEAEREADRRVEVIVAPTPEAPRRLRFGFVLETIAPPKVVRVLPGTPVDRAGVRSGDVLVRVDGEPATIHRVQAAARTTAPGDTVEIVIRRNGEEQTVRVIPEENVHVVVIDPDSIAERARHYVERAGEWMKHWSPDSFRFEIDSLVRFRLDSLMGPMDSLTVRFPHGFAWAMPEIEAGHRGFVMPEIAARGPFSFAFSGPMLGLRLTALNEGLSGYFPGAEEGLLVLEVAPGSPAGEAGVEPGDVVVEVNGRRVPNLGSFHAAREPGDTTLGVVRRGERREIRIEGSDGPG